jgi:hypothetical protein
MKRFSPKTLSLITAGVLSLASAAFAQQGPPPGGPPDQGGQDDRRGPGGPQDDNRPRVGQRGDGGGPGQRPDGPPDGGQGGRDNMGPNHPLVMSERNRPQGGPQGGPPEVARFMAFLNMVDSYAKLAKDPDAASVAAVVSAADVLRPKGAQGAIDYFTKILPDVKSPTVQRAIRLQLMDFYKASNQPDKALEQLQLIMTTGDSAKKD